jgi:hypothetical protein
MHTARNARDSPFVCLILRFQSTVSVDNPDFSRNMSIQTTGDEEGTRAHSRDWGGQLIETFDRNMVGQGK